MTVFIKSSQFGYNTNVMSNTLLCELQTFCDANIHRFDKTDRDFPYTVGPPEIAIAFFKDFVFKRTYIKYVPISSDIRTQIYIRTDDEPSLSTTLNVSKINY